MVFHSTGFFFFFCSIFIIYWRLNHRNQNHFLLLVSYIFYGIWNWRFIPLLGLSSLLTFFIGNRISQGAAQSKGRLFLTMGVLINFGVLFFFKYFNFFIENLYNLLGQHTEIPVLKVLLPLGISFYTFKAIAYCVDLYRGQIKPAASFFDFALYLSFFPQIIAGPIDRPASMLAQIEKPRHFIWEQFYRGCFLIGWGLVQKLFIADNLTALVDPVFASKGSQDPSTMLLTMYIYAFQLYNDFAGYSNISWGIAKTMGFESTHNFNLPFFSVNIQSFWNRWHISLSLWIREYLYTPIFLGLNKLPTVWRLYVATFFSMLFIGLWHGAAWHYILYGVYHGVLLCLYATLKPWLQKISFKEKSLPYFVWQGIRILFVFHLTAFGFLMFRAENCGQFFLMLRTLSSAFPHYAFKITLLFDFIFFISISLIVEWLQFQKNDRWAIFLCRPPFKVLFYVLCFYLLTLYGASSAKEYIYFQF